jgi:hypothetical protein
LKNTDGCFCGQPDIKVSDFSSIYFIKQRSFFSRLLFLWHVLCIVEIRVVFVDENVMCSVALYRKQIGQDWRYIRVGKLLVFIDFNKKYNHSALRFCVFLSKICHSWQNNVVTHLCAARIRELLRYLVIRDIFLIMKLFN